MHNTSALIHKHRSFILYGIIGLSGAVLDLIVFFLLYDVLHLNALLASALSTSIGILNNFFLNILINFKVKDRLLSRFIAFYLVGSIGLVLGIVILFVLHSILGISANIAKVASIPLVVLFQYFLNSRISLADDMWQSVRALYNKMQDLTAFNTLNKRRALFATIPLVLVTFYFIRAYQSPITFDEAYNLQIPVNLVNHATYATNGSNANGQLRAFDPYISTGPTLLVPIAIVFKLFGVGITQYRLVCIVVYILLLFSLLYLIRSAVKHSVLGYCIGFLFTSLLVTANIQDGPILSANIQDVVYSNTAIGEPMAALFLVLTAILLNKKRFVSASALLGLAILTKLLAVIALPVLGAIFIQAIVQKQTTVKKALTGLGLVILPSLLFEGYRFNAFGKSIENYKANMIEFINFFKLGGSGVHNISHATFQEKLTTLHTINYSGSKLLIIFGVVIFTVIMIYSLTKTGHHTYGKVIPFLLKRNDILFCIFTSLPWVVWWVFLSDRAYLRHVWPAFILFGASLAMLLAKVTERRLSLSLSNVLQGISYGLAIVLVFLSIRHAGTQRSYPLSLQIKDAAAIQNIIGNGQLYGIGWWQNPDIQFINHRTSRPVDTAPAGDGWIVMEDIYQELEPQDYATKLRSCNQVVKISSYYDMCRFTVKGIK